MTPALSQTLAMIAAAAQSATDRWWLIGSAAVVLHGGSVEAVKDVDLMMSPSDAEAFLRRTGGHVGGAQPSNRFRSKIFGVWSAPPVPIEVFGGFRLAADRQWRDVVIASREPVTVGGSQVFVPSREELIQLLHAFGRPKDLERTRSLQR